MSADFWAGYLSGAVGILIGNPLDIIKTRLQAGSQKEATSAYTAAEERDTSSCSSKSSNSNHSSSHLRRWTAFARGSAAPILGYGALNALLFVTYNRSLALLNNGNIHDWPERPSVWSLWTAGALGGLATFVVSAPTELVKCRAQVSSNPPMSSLDVTRDLWKRGKIRGLYLGGGVTSMRDAVGYGFYFLSYELSKRAVFREDDGSKEHAVKVLMCGGIAGVITWASVFPLDMIKTRVQTWDLTYTPRQTVTGEHRPLLETSQGGIGRPGTLAIARNAYRTEGAAVFFRGLGVCSVRAFIVNAVQWAVYEWTLSTLSI